MLVWEGRILKPCKDAWAVQVFHISKCLHPHVHFTCYKRNLEVLLQLLTCRLENILLILHCTTLKGEQEPKKSLMVRFTA